MIKNEFCSICESADWKSLDYLRNQKHWYDRNVREESEPVGFKICKECGFITYDYVELDRLEEHYNRERPVMTAGNTVTCNRKNEYHKAFLKDVIDQLVSSKDGVNIFDSGCAQGSFLNMMKLEIEVGDDDLLQGTEWSAAFRGYAKNEYGLDIATEIDDSIKYDLISYYHVLEHIQWPGKELQKIRKSLKDDGVLYLSVPVWTDILEEASGSLTNDFENYYHLNHVNVFSQQSFRNILNANGFEIIKEDTEMYGYTVLCKKSDVSEIVKEDYKEKVKILETEKKAIELVHDDNKKPEEAIKIMPNFPDAYIFMSLNKTNMKSFDNQIDILKKGLKACPDNLRIKMQIARVYFQWDQNTPDKHFYSNNIKQAEKIFTEVLGKKPGADEAYYFLGVIEGNYKKDYDKAVEYIKKQLDINPQKWTEGNNLISYWWKEKEKAV